MSYQLFNDGACIRIQRLGQNNEVKILMVSKDQIRTIDIIKDNVVRIDIGEGPLKNIFLNYQEVTFPNVNSANDLRDEINAMMKSEIYDGDSPSEITQREIVTKLSDIATILQAIKLKEADLAQQEPSRLDESNPYMVYRGWHKAFGVPDAPEWAIERIRREGDEFIHEWAFGTQRQVYTWTDRLNHNYVPYDHDLPIESPLPIMPDSNPPVEQQR